MRLVSFGSSSFWFYSQRLPVFAHLCCSQVDCTLPAKVVVGVCVDEETKLLRD